MSVVDRSSTKTLPDLEASDLSPSLKASSAPSAQTARAPERPEVQLATTTISGRNPGGRRVGSPKNPSPNHLLTHKIAIHSLDKLGEESLSRLDNIERAEEKLLARLNMEMHCAVCI
ncbi:hypothetical protein G7Y89_g1179 [Cudoniella acicularis]|uniref:Uncharacterized protein n=1 Tax=Cudoniella acicularis TaxID=354080 RepID=A0A8H4RVS6_9HELO|nr:hypothetical protein G7Y89_g1179 [Cudoniella acicularis]